MSARRYITLFTVVIAAIGFGALPAHAFAGTSDLSAVDAITADVSTDGKSDQSSENDKVTASDSPTVDSYSGGGTDSVPPPVDCQTTSTSSSSSSEGSSQTSEGGSSTTSGSEPCTPPSTPECSAGDTDGLDATGAPCVKESCADVVAGGTTSDGQVCGGGSQEEPADSPAPDPAAGGGAPETVPVKAVGGGGPELPFTGLPLMYAIWGGFGLMLMGSALWVRAAIAGRKG